jgi:hypothetical protein
MDALLKTFDTLEGKPDRERAPSTEHALAKVPEVTLGFGSSRLPPPRLAKPAAMPSRCP